PSGKRLFVDRVACGFFRILRDTLRHMADSMGCLVRRVARAVDELVTSAPHQLRFPAGGRCAESYRQANGHRRGAECEGALAHRFLEAIFHLLGAIARLAAELVRLRASGLSPTGEHVL